MNTFGQHLKITFSGTSHGPEIGIVIEGLPAGLALDEDLIRAELTKRRPKNELSTPRREPDRYEIRSGMKAGLTNGEPLFFAIPNEDVRSGDYDALAFLPRPGHADYPAYVKTHGAYDSRGGGMYSGRLTALYMIIGAIARQILNRKGIVIGSHILALGSVSDRGFDPVAVSADQLRLLESIAFPVIDPDVETPMKAAILAAKADRDSVGGIIETAIVGLPTGVGEPLFHSIESQLAALLFSVPAVKGIEFGDGFSFGSRHGSAVKDEYAFAPDGTVITLANHNGGIVGGMATGMPVILRTVIKPTASIGQPQQTVDLVRKTTAMLEIVGRHDPAIVHRAVHVVNAAVYYGILDLMLAERPREWML